MPEIFQPIECYQVQYVCDACQKGIMAADGVMLTSNPPQYPHTCGSCGHKENFYSIYPCITHTGEAVDYGG